MNFQELLMRLSASCFAADRPDYDWKTLRLFPETLVLIPIGYPENPDVFASTPKKRKAFNEIVKWGKY